VDTYFIMGEILHGYWPEMEPTTSVFPGLVAPVMGAIGSGMMRGRGGLVEDCYIPECMVDLGFVHTK